MYDSCHGSPISDDVRAAWVRLWFETSDTSWNGVMTFLSKARASRRPAALSSSPETQSTSRAMEASTSISVISCGHKGLLRAQLR